ncbi:MAG: hypothetical protein NTU97_00615, partial [Candidatus Magasanikbacteria bacterium]|nr:hypothetical protein [Candidatus Magasanikbacteria bacterium]
LVASAILFVGCGGQPERPRKDQMQEIGFLGQRVLHRIIQTDERMPSRVFLNIGLQRLQFYWGRTSGEYVSTVLPCSSFRFVIDESKAVPTVEFIFDEDWLNLNRAVYTESQKSNPNLWFEPQNVGNLSVVLVRMSQKDFERETDLLVR